MGNLLDTLSANPGVYVGADSDPTDTSGAPPSSARITVSPLPGGSGVVMDYEVLSAERGRVHSEHAVLARSAGGLVLVTAHNHAPMATVLRETEPGYFPAAEGDSPFPMAIRLEAPGPGELVYSWAYGEPGGEVVVRDIARVQRVTG